MSKNQRLKDEANIFPESKIANPSPEQAIQINTLNRIKDDFSKAVIEFKAILKDTTLPEQRMQNQRDRQNAVLQDLNKYAGDLEKINVGEGVFSLVFVGLSGLLALRDELNSLRFQNLMLMKKISSLSKEDN